MHRGLNVAASNVTFHPKSQHDCRPFLPPLRIEVKAIRLLCRVSFPYAIKLTWTDCSKAIAATTTDRNAKHFGFYNPT